MLANLAYLLALTLASPWILYRMICHQRYRRGGREKLWGLSATRGQRLTAGQPCLWVHAVSVGEVNLLPRLIERIERQEPNQRVVVSTSTDTGYELAVKHFGTDRVFFCPLDFTWAVRRTLRHLNPKKVVLAELELWPNLIRQSRQHGAEVIVINARLSDRSCRRYHQFSFLTKRIFASLTWVGCQDKACFANFAQCGTPRERMSVTGSLKFDDAPHSRETQEVKRCRQWAAITPKHQVWIVGSTQMDEEQMALRIYKAIQNHHPELRMILVPRHKERFAETAGLITRSEFKVRRRSTDSEQADFQWQNDTVLLIDTIGELRHWWGVAQIATVGGSFGDRGGQNMLEPAGYGAAVSFGPNTRNFRQIAECLIDNEAAVRVDDQNELQAFVQQCLDDASRVDALGRAAQAVVRQHCGATERTIAAIFGQAMPPKRVQAA
ncbi:MAG: 3-deoxy-D-manno-octulosonic acid transferase [Rubripirellula sp.]